MTTGQPLHNLNAGALAPVADEVTLTDLPVTGQLPAELNGLLVRNGPNPFGGAFDGTDMLDWWVAPSMVHGLSIGEGHARWYRNRWPRSDAWAAHHHVAPPHNIPTNTNVNVVAHGDRLMALGEGAPPARLSPMLDTLGGVTFDGALPNGMMAHPKVDPATGAMHFFRADWQEPHLQLGTISAAGALTETRTVELPGPVMMHDFAITENFDVVLDLNVVYDFSLLGSGVPIPLRWDDKHRARVGAVPRNGEATIWFDITPCFVQHVVNAYETADRQQPMIVVDVVRYPEFLRFNPNVGGYAPNPLGTLWRIELDLTGRTCRETQLDDRHIELPRIDERATGRPHRWLYAVDQPTDTEMRGLRAYDVVSGTQMARSVAPGDQNSEPVFVPSSNALDDGWLLTCVYRAITDSTDVLLLNAADIGGEPVATITLPRRIPAGFHGSWIPQGHLAHIH